MTELASIHGIQENAVAAERERLDGLIQQLAKELRDLRLQRNLLAPIFCLPAEMVLKIFDACRENSRYWIRETTHICSTWRELALSASTLWASPNLGRPTMAKEMLRRSGTSPLDVSINNSYWYWRSPNEAVEEMLAHHSRRIRDMHVDTSPENFRALVKWCTQPAPMLKSLDLAYRPKGKRLLRMGALFAADLHSLTDLKLIRCQVDSMVPFAKNLQSLDLQGLAVPMDQLHDTLRSAGSRLRKLIISESSLRNASTQPYHPSVVRFPALRSISILGDTALRTEAFLAPLKCSFSDFESNDMISISLTRLSDHESTQGHLSAIATWVKSSIAVPITRVFLDGDGHVIHGFPGRCATSHPGRLSSPVNLRLHTRHHPVLVGLLFTAYVRELPWAPITLLDVLEGSHIQLPDGGWGDFFRCAKSVETLAVYTGTAYGHPELLALAEKDGDGSVVLP